MDVLELRHARILRTLICCRWRLPSSSSMTINQESSSSKYKSPHRHADAYASGSPGAETSRLWGRCTRRGDRHTHRVKRAPRRDHLCSRERARSGECCGQCCVRTVTGSGDNIRCNRISPLPQLRVCQGDRGLGRPFQCAGKRCGLEVGVDGLSVTNKIVSSGSNS